MTLTTGEEVFENLKANDIVSPELVYPTDRDIFMKSAKSWLNGKRVDDNLGGKDCQLWRIHDSLYDLTDFIHKHPGGSDFIQKTMATDITEAFEASHIVNAKTVEATLKKYFVRKTNQPRTSKFTFKENGFYKTLKRRVEPVLKEHGTSPSSKILMLHNGLIILFLTSMITVALTSSLKAAICCGIILGMLQTLSHNFFHQRPTWRMYVWDFSMFSSRDWRITHALSHHLYTSTYYDVELASIEPFLLFPPAYKKTIIQKYIAPIYVLIFYAVIPLIEYMKKIAFILNGQEKLRPENLFPVLELIAMSLINGEYYTSFQLWIVMHLVSSLWFITLPQIGSHRHPESYHVGDKASEQSIKNNFDWGVHQLETGYDVTGKSNWFIFKKISFGDHRLHHLFPTVDHSKLHHLYLIAEETCKEFGISFETRSAWNMLVGHFSLMWKTTARKSNK